MSQRIRAEHDKTFQERLSEEVRRLEREAATTPSDAYRDLLLRRVSQLEAASRLEKWLSSPGLRPPT
ncbi:MAG: hypothetical protein NTAFB05_04250 [Nitrobacter sp.]|uniref:hypothetical protein n=1 Tax=Nitrobacter sp. TaxID=29420 RepID=UPI00387DF6CA